MRKTEPPQEKFIKYAEILREWNSRMNLVAPGTLNDIQARHIADSAQLADYLPQNATIADLGSGAGFPGTVLASLGRNVICIESVGKKTRFLEELKRRLDLPNLTIINDRVEKFLARMPAAGFETLVFTARAFAPLARILNYVAAARAPLGNIRIFLLKGANINSEIIEAEKEYKFDYELFPSKTGDGFVIAIKNLKKIQEIT
jgi:16S rRNA (guanine527-N7)-methyltransferase